MSGLRIGDWTRVTKTNLDSEIWDALFDQFERRPLVLVRVGGSRGSRTSRTHRLARTDLCFGDGLLQLGPLTEPAFGIAWGDEFMLGQDGECQWRKPDGAHLTAVAVS